MSRKNVNSDIWKIGHIINFVNSDRNFFIRQYDTYRPVIENLPVTAYYKQHKHRFEDMPHQELLSIIDSYQSTLQDSYKYIRERVFEDVRLKYYPHLPSRMRGLFLCDKSSLSYWWRTLKYKDKIIKVRVSGRIHKADQRHARYESHEINIFNNNALQYWAGVDGVNSHEQEILFEGVLQVIGVYTKYEECYEQELKKEE